MKKLLTLFDNYFLKLGVIFTFAFIALYPKLPSIHIVRTWVYIRLEDFVIASLVIVWLIQLLRRKVKLPFPVGWPIGIYWLAGFVSLILCLLFVGPHLVGFFPHLAILEYGRRIEYMILFFIAFTIIRSEKDVKDFIVTMIITISAIVLYGFGQRFYLVLWAAFPKFFEHFSFCFPSFQTGNEEFAKGLALCLPQEARITSTFGGHYDLAAFLVVVLPVLLGVFVSVKRVALKIGTGLLFVLALMLLIFTASRVSFSAYLIGAIFALIFMKKKWLLIPVIGISIICLFAFSSATVKRFAETFRVVNVVTNNQGQVVGLAENNLPDSLKNKISKNDSVVVEAPPSTQNLPTGSSFITLSQTAKATSGAYITAPISTTQAQKLKLANGGLEISTVSGSFLIQKALVYDISFTTRFQAEWPNAWAAFLSDPPFGKGYSTITLATDNDYLRLLGESGFVGFASFALIFLVFAIFVRESVAESSGLTKFYVLGLAGGVIGLILNASLIDVFEASKVAEPLWILLGVAVGGLSLTFTKHVDYIGKIKKVVSSHLFLLILLCILAFILFGGGLNNFFVADDFTWLKWAATSHPSDLLSNFINAHGSIYRPVAQAIMFFMYSVFSFQPTGYHVVGLFVHFFIAVGVYFLGMLVFKKKLWATILSALYLILPVHAEVLFWISTISVSWCALFMMYAVLSYTFFREKKLPVLYAVSLLLGLLSLFTYEMGVVLPALLFIVDVYFTRKVTKKSLLHIAPFIFLDILYLFVRSTANVVAVGGDYSYSMVHLIPNFIANFINYVFATFIGEKVVAWQYLLRLGLKSYALPTTVGLLAVVLVGGFIVYLLRKKMNRELVSQILLGFSFAFVALLPFLGLGNISERYTYLATVGLAIVVVSLAQFISQKMGKSFVVKGALILIGVAFFFYAKWAITSELSQWQYASTVTYNALAYFRVVKEDLPQGATLYVSHMPTKYGNAWIFPVGFDDGLWFIYRDDALKVVKTSSVAESLSIKHSHPSAILNHEYVFDFDKNGQMFEY